MQQDTFDAETALAAALELQRVLAARTHRRKVMGQVVLIPGQLGEALHLPAIIRRLRSKHKKTREQGLADFLSLWPTLSEQTRQKVLTGIGWYDPRDLAWDDKRSNRRPLAAPDRNSG